MGLDMYLEAELRTYRPFGDAEPDTMRLALEQAADAIGLPKSDNLDFIEITREIGYWRKANQIHAWFVEHVQEGNDDCRTYHVPRGTLAELRTLCQQVIDGSTLVEGEFANGYTYKDGQESPIIQKGKVIADPALAKALLPNQAGFFFGSTEYHEWYLDDLKETIAIIDKCLALPDGINFNYHSSW